ncbi:MAG: hypothetical protein F6J96_03475 [Symploca sp. SIO1C2]|nr:hypothetical protein [Symploca sp. SIO1C2]NER48886.1 hypothetical protein [Symploca sp. SIO1A3]
MKDDLKKGALLPAITLAVKLDKVEELLPLLENKKPDYKALAQELNQPGLVNILDGLQRTYILKEIVEDEDSLFSNFSQDVLVEFWFEPEIRNLIYRIIVLNAGQKPMSMKHQIDLLFMTFKDIIERDLDIKIYTNKQKRQRTKPRNYALDRIATAYQCFITRSPEVQKQNFIAQRLLEENVFNSNEKELGEKFDRFKKYLRIYADLDEEVCRIYNKNSQTDLPNGTTWFGSENVINSFFAAIASSNSSERVDKALNVLIDRLKDSIEEDDPLDLETLQQIQKGVNPRKVNIGFATRKLLTTGFKEYFRDEGETSFADSWKRAAD